MAKLDEKGHEILDPTPVAIPVGFHKPPTLEERMMRFIRSEQLRMYNERTGTETFDEADDFDVGDDIDPHSPYEEHFDHLQNLEADRNAASVPKNSKFQEETPVEQKKAPDRKTKPKKQAKAEATQTDIEDFIDPSEEE